MCKVNFKNVWRQCCELKEERRPHKTQVTEKKKDTLTIFKFYTFFAEKDIIKMTSSRAGDFSDT